MIDGQIHIWDVTDIWAFVVQELLETNDLPVNEFSKDIDPWFQQHTRPTIKHLLEHYNRVMESDLDFPIILDPEGNILDGMHRFMKACLEKRKTIKAFRLRVYPPSLPIPK